ncbi:MAG: hypothetical protein SGPRY_011980 [Prymnesium sp.]
MVRGAVAVVCLCARTQRCALIRRGKPPDLGKWSLPGGSIHTGERAIDAALRELSEETGLRSDDVRFCGRPFATSDVIVPSDGSKFHYLIAQAFCTTAEPIEPSLTPGDDASEAAWFSLDVMSGMHDREEIAGDCLAVVERAFSLRAHGLL